MRTEVTTVEELKEIFFELLINNTDKVTKISAGSVVNAHAYGIAKIGQKAIKDIAITESRIFPESASGDELDNCAKRRGVAARFVDSESSTYVRVVGDAGTVYTAGVHTFSGKEGIVFDIENDTTIGPDGFAYVKVRSKTNGSTTNVEALTLNIVTPIPTGHIYCINEYSANGGRDIEDDETFRRRIIDTPNIVAKDTLSRLTQAFCLINNNVLRVYYNGTTLTGKTSLSLLSQNGIDFTQAEFNAILNKSQEMFSLSELQPYRNSYGFQIELGNIVWQPLDISARVELHTSYNADDVRREIQIRINKHLDYRYWEKSKIEWDDLLTLVKTTPGVKYVYDNYFTPNNDIHIEKGKLPRVRGFLLLNSEGNLLSNTSGTLNPVYYPKEADFSYQRTIFKSLI